MVQAFANRNPIPFLIATFGFNMSLTKVNPYQSATDGLETNPDDGIPQILWELDADRLARVVRGMKTIRIGYWVALVSLVGIGGIVFFQSAWPRPGAFASISMFLLVGLGLLTAMLGLTQWGALLGVHQKLALLALALQMIAMVAMIGYLSVVVSGRPLSGMLRLFGASGFATLLTSQAIVALIVRSWAERGRFMLATHACELSVMGCAVCAATCSLVALRAIPDGGLTTICVIVIAGIAGIGGLLAALSAVIRPCNLAVEYHLSGEVTSIEGKS